MNTVVLPFKCSCTMITKHLLWRVFSSVFIYLYLLLDGVDEIHWNFDMKQHHMRSIIIQTLLLLIARLTPLSYFWCKTTMKFGLDYCQVCETCFIYALYIASILLLFWMCLAHGVGYVIDQKFTLEGVDVLFAFYFLTAVIRMSM